MSDSENEEGRSIVGDATANHEGSAGDSNHAETKHAASAETSEPSTDPRELQRYLDAGWELIPLHRYSDRNSKGSPVGKAPRDFGWRKRAYAIDAVLANARANRNTGVRLRASDLVLDVDPRNFPEGRDVLAELVAATDIDLSSMPHVVTGSGGSHYYMRKAGDAPVRATLPDFPGIELKTLGVQVVAAGSVHPNGRLYVWDDLSPPLTEAPNAHEPLLRLFERKVRERSGDAPSVSPEQLATMLAALDPTQFRDHDRWLRIMMASHSATNGEGMDEFLEWSCSDPTYTNDRTQIAKRWDTLHDSGPSSSVTALTLFKELKDAGRGELIPQASVSEDDFSDDAGEPDSADGWLARLNRDHYAITAGKFRVLRRVPDPIMGRYAWATSSRQDFEAAYANRKVECAAPDGEPRTKPLGRAWIEWPDRRSVDGVVFDPERDHPGFLNLWEGWSVAPAAGDWSLLKELVRDVVCDGDAACFEYAMSWMANLVQRPASVAEVAWVMRGAKGTGKSTVGRYLTELAGRHGLCIASPGLLTGRFNAHLRDCLVLFADEAFWAGDKRGEAVLKQLVTEPAIMYEGKGQDASKGPNRVHLIVASNERWVVPAGIDGERRFFVCDVNDTRRGDRAFFGALHEQMRDGGMAAMLRELLDRDISGWHPRDCVPVTAALIQQKELGLDPVSAWWLDVLRSGTLPGPVLDWAGGPVSALVQDLVNDYARAERAMGMRGSRRALETEFGMAFRALVPGLEKRPVTLPEGRIDVAARSDGRAWAYELPSLDECRAHFASELLGAPAYEWPAEGPAWLE